MGVICALLTRLDSTERGSGKGEVGTEEREGGVEMVLGVGRVERVGLDWIGLDMCGSDGTGWKRLFIPRGAASDAVRER